MGILLLLGGIAMRPCGDECLVRATMQLAGFGIFSRGTVSRAPTIVSGLLARRYQAIVFALLQRGALRDRKVTFHDLIPPSALFVGV